MAKRREIRNSTAEFLIFQIEGKSQGAEVFYKDKTVWCTQKAMGMLFDCTSDNISVHLQNIYDTDELKKEATTEKISVVRREGNRDVNRTLQFYNLDAIISVGYRVNSIRRSRGSCVRRDPMIYVPHGTGTSPLFQITRVLRFIWSSRRAA